MIFLKKILYCYQARGKSDISETEQAYCDLIKQGNISLEYRSTKEMIADGLTKALGPIAFKEFIKSLGLTTIAAAMAEPSRDACPE